MKPEPVYNPQDVEALSAPKVEVQARQPVRISEQPGVLTPLADALKRLVNAILERLQPAVPLPLWLTIPQASAHTGLSRGFLVRLIRTGRLPALRYGCYRVRKADLDNIGQLAQVVEIQPVIEAGSDADAKKPLLYQRPEHIFPLLAPSSEKPQ
jgi:excisionase family DNA binding protein